MNFRIERKQLSSNPSKYLFGGSESYRLRQKTCITSQSAADFYVLP